ncbi:MAG: terminase gpA endonuclease subunit [Rhodospirillales bacterium]
MSKSLQPPPPANLVAWAAHNIVFGSDSPFPGPFNIERFPFFKRPLEVLSPDHPARVVLMMKSAQLGGTVLAQIFAGGCLDLAPSPFLYTHPTDGNAGRWARQKWKPMVRRTAALSRLFSVAKARDAANSVLYQERKDGQGFIQISGANSEASLSMMSVPRQVQDDLAKWDMNNAGDPETQADSRSQAFEWAKIFKVGTPMLEDSCRVTANFKRSTQDHYHIPCPHCGHEHPLEWENMLAALDEAHPENACFTCPACGGVIEQKHREQMNARGGWVAHNPGASIVGFYIWSAYSPLQSWARIAEAWLAAKGDPAKEQAFLNDTVGRPFKAAGESPPWETIRDRANATGHLAGHIPPGALLLAIGCDCQIDRVEWNLYGFGRDLKRWQIESGVIEGHVSEARAQRELDTLLTRVWPDDFGNRRAADILAIDANYAKVEVMDWARRHPQERVICVRGAKGDAAPELALVREERLPNGTVRRYQKRFWHVGVSGLKSALYRHLSKADPVERGYVAYPQGLDDESYRQLCAERRAPVKRKDGFVEWRWVKASTQKNEFLDTTVYAEAAAIRLGWKRMTEADWDREQTRREAPAPDLGQLDLLEPKLDKASAGPAAPAKKSATLAEQMTPQDCGEMEL